MIQLSSNITLFLRVFIPIFWLTFFGTFLLVALFVVEEPRFLGVPINSFRIGLALFWLSGFILFYFTLFKLRRIDADGEFVHASDYFRNFRYPYHNIEKITIEDMGIVSVGKIYLHVAGNFGKKLSFLASKKRIDDFVKQYPALVPLIQTEQ